MEARRVTVEVDIGPGLPALQMVGLADAAVQEARERVRAAIRNSGLRVPLTRVVVSLAPAGLRKAGPGFDLPIALALLVASGQLPPARLEGVWSAAELGLDGRLRPIRGVLALAATARREGARVLVVPAANAAEASLVEGLTVWGAEDLTQVLAGLADPHHRSAVAMAASHRVEGDGSGREGEGADGGGDLADVRGQPHGRRALEIAAAGGHHLLLIGPQGSGKTMLARRLAGLMPPLERGEALELTQLHSVAGLLPEGGGLLDRRPFRAPHHSCSGPALIGGGGLPRPGELSLAHHGVLFLDELAEFRADVLDQLRQPLEAGEVWICRTRQRCRFPCRIVLVGATNPCPCGWYGDPTQACRCGEEVRRRYWSRLSGPLLDRIDLQVVMRRAAAGDLADALRAQPPAPGGAAGRAEGTAVVAARVREARARMTARNPGGRPNGELPVEGLRPVLQIEDSALDLWERALERRRLSARGGQRVLRVARTISDLEGRKRVDGAAVAEALTYRSFDRID